jgi:uncharacterized protein (TIGR00730 family)
MPDDVRMSMIRSVCVYCGSSPGVDPAFITAAEGFGRILAREGVGLVYGGGSNGLMGALARSAHEHGGRVIGVIPEFLKARELAFRGSDELIVTPDMHERKRIMFERADAFVALPGGIGTLEELIEQLTWAQLGRHKKPILFADINGFWRPLIELLDHMKRTGFIHSDLFFEYLVATKIEDIIPQLRDAARRRADEELAGAKRVIEKL